VTATACPRCAELEEEVAYLRAELGLQRDETQIALVREALPLGIPGRVGVARFLLALYAARGRVMTYAQIMEAVPPKAGGDDDRTYNLITIWACWARKALGRDIIDTVFGHGYRLTPEGLTRVRRLLTGEARAA